MSLVKNLIKQLYFLMIYYKLNKYTMIPKKIYLSNLKLCWNFSNNNGAIVECGVWKGGMIAGMSFILGSKRDYYLYDSFEGLPNVQLIDGPNAVKWQSNEKGEYYFDNCKAEEKYAREAMHISKAKNYKIIKGWFSETITKNYLTPKEIAILRIDGDWYDSTLVCLENLFPKVRNGGLIIFDDYLTWDGCSRAVHDYLSNNLRNEKIRTYNEKVAYIIKSE